MYNSKILKNSSITLSEPLCIDNYLNFIHVEQCKPGIEENKQVLDIDKATTLAENILVEAEQKAERLLAKANDEIEMMRKQLFEEIEELRFNALREAKEEGYDLGFKEGSAIFSEKITLLDKKSQELQTNYCKIINAAEEEIIRLVCTIVKKVVNEDVLLDVANLKHLVLEGLKLCYDKSSSTIKLSKADYEIIMADMPDVLQQIAEFSQIELKYDIALKNKSCIVETPNGTIDLSIDKRLNKVFKDIEETSQFQ